MTETYSVIALQMLDEMVEKVGKDTVITKDEAERIFGGTRDYEVGELTRTQLLQLALFEAYALLLDVTEKQRPNRATRRKK